MFLKTSRPLQPCLDYCPRVTLWCLYPQLSVLFMLGIKFCTFKTGSESWGGEEAESLFSQTALSAAQIAEEALLCS